MFLFQIINQFNLFRNCLIKQPQDEDPDEGVRDLVEIALRKLDIDKDGKVCLLLILPYIFILNIIQFFII